jgi:hypothetical protein
VYRSIPTTTVVDVQVLSVPQRPLAPKFQDETGMVLLVPDGSSIIGSDFANGSSKPVKTIS